MLTRAASHHQTTSSAVNLPSGFVLRLGEDSLGTEVDRLPVRNYSKGPRVSFLMHAYHAKLSVAGSMMNGRRNGVLFFFSF